MDTLDSRVAEKRSCGPAPHRQCGQRRGRESLDVKRGQQAGTQAKSGAIRRAGKALVIAGTGEPGPCGCRAELVADVIRADLGIAATCPSLGGLTGISAAAEGTSEEPPNIARSYRSAPRRRRNWLSWCVAPGGPLQSRSSSSAIGTGRTESEETSPPPKASTTPIRPGRSLTLSAELRTKGFAQPHASRRPRSHDGLQRRLVYRPGRVNFHKKVRPALGGEPAAREPIWGRGGVGT
jgi:hypothetical protein